MDRSAAITEPSRLRERLTGVRGLLLDMDGVLVLRGKPIDGAAEALARVVRLGIPHRLVTNASLRSRQALAARLAELGLPVEPARIVSALSATAAYTRRRYAGRPIYVLAAPAALDEFDGQKLLDNAEAVEEGRAVEAGSAATGSPHVATGSPRVAAVVVGDAGEALTYENLNAACRLVAAGARLIAVHRNAWWLTEEGRTIDSGAFVRAIEYASGRRAFLVGKPSAAFFRAAFSDLRREVPDVLPADVTMVGDDLRADILAAQRAGMRGVLVLTGRHGLADVNRAAGRAPTGRAAGRAAGRADAVPDAIASSLAEVVAALG